MSDPRQTGRSSGAGAGGESGDDSTLIRSANDFYGEEPPKSSSRADRVMGRMRNRSGAGSGAEAPVPDRSAGARSETGATPNRAAGDDRPTSQEGNQPVSGKEPSKPMAAQESKGGRARLGAAAASAGGVVGGLTGRNKAARTGDAANAVPAPGNEGSRAQGSQAEGSQAQGSQATASRATSADSATETNSRPAQARGNGAAGGAAAGAAAGAATARSSNSPAGSDGSSSNNEPSGLANAESPKKQLGAARRTLKARLRISQVDPWSVMKTAFLFSIAAGIVLWVAVGLVYLVLDRSGLFVTINQTIGDIISTPGDDTPFDITQYASGAKVMGATTVIAVIDVVIFTALATLGAFLYNLASAMIGGLEVTLAED